MPKREHTFAIDSEQRVVVAYPEFCSPCDYMVARIGQLRALGVLMVNAADTVGDMGAELRADLLWLSQMLSSEIADAVEQIGLNEPQVCA